MYPDIRPTYVLPPAHRDQAHPEQLGQPTLFTEGKTGDLLSYMENSFLERYLSSGKWGLQARGISVS